MSHSNTLRSKNLKDIYRLIEYLTYIQENGYAVGFQYSGHVDWFEVKVAESPDLYDNIIFDGGYPAFEFTKHTTEQEYSDVIDETITAIKQAIYDFQIEAQEREMLARLKEKYEGGE